MLLVAAGYKDPSVVHSPSSLLISTRLQQFDLRPDFSPSSSFFLCFIIPGPRPPQAHPPPIVLPLLAASFVARSSVHMDGTTQTRQVDEDYDLISEASAVHEKSFYLSHKGRPVLPAPSFIFHRHTTSTDTPHPRARLLHEHTCGSILPTGTPPRQTTPIHFRPQHSEPARVQRPRGIITGRWMKASMAFWLRI
jgi:hypothetical protein